MSVSPKPGAKDVSLDVVGRVAFDKAIREGWVALEISPRVPFTTKLSLERTSLIFTFQKNLEAGKEYTMRASGPYVKPITWSFETKAPEGEGDLQAGIGSEDFKDTEQEFYEKNPLIQYVPVITDEFKIVRPEPQVAKIYLYLDDKEAAKDAALNWFKENNINVNEIEIRWME